MIGLALIAAAAQGPVLLARNDEVQWRMFVRAGYEAAAPERARPTARLRELEEALHGLTDRTQRPASIKGPTGL
jgi:hypothetical protein